MIHVKLIGLTQCLENGSEPERLIARAGRVCYKSRGDEGKKFNAFIEARIREGHFSVLEHVSLTFEISGISRTCSHQLVRHRHLSFSQESQRRVDASDVRFVTPPSVCGDPKAVSTYESLLSHAVQAYKDLRKAGIKKEDCRFVLPGAAETKIVVTGNLRALRDFFDVRLGGGTQWEIRTLAERMLQVAHRAIPSAFEDLHLMFIKGRNY